MKKMLFGASLLSLTFMLTGCKDEVKTSEMVLDKTKEAKFVVYAYAELDKTKNGYEKAPDGTLITLRVSNRNFNDAATDYWLKTFDVQDGKIEATIPASNTGVEVEIIPFEFIYNQKQPFGSVNNTVAKIYRYNGKYPTDLLLNGDIKSHEVVYNSVASFEDYTETVKRNFKLTGIFDETAGTTSGVPNGTTVNFFSGNWSTQITMNNNDGNVDNIDLPVGQAISIRFEASKKVSASDSKNYRYDSSVGPFDSTSPVRQTVNFGGGVVWQ